MLASLRGELNLTSDVLAFLVAVIAVALVGGFVPAILVAVAGSLLLNYYFTPPVHKFTIAEANNALALLVFVAVAIIVSYGGGPGRPAHPAGSAGQCGVGAAGHRVGQRAAWPARRGGSAGPGARGVRHAVGHAAGMRAQPEHRGAQPDLRVAGGGPFRRAAGDQASRRGRGGAGRRDDVAGAARPDAARLGPAGAGRVRRLRRGGAGAAAAGRRSRGGPADRRGRPDAHRAARRGQPRPAHPTGVGQGRGNQPAVG